MQCPLKFLPHDLLQVNFQYLDPVSSQPLPYDLFQVDQPPYLDLVSSQPLPHDLLQVPVSLQFLPNYLLQVNISSWTQCPCGLFLMTYYRQTASVLGPSVLLVFPSDLLQVKYLCTWIFCQFGPAVCAQLIYIFMSEELYYIICLDINNRVFSKYMSPFGELPLQCFPDAAPHLEVNILVNRVSHI